MTILGLRTFSPDAAALWTDSEVLSWADGSHRRYRSKLVATGAGFAIAAGGWDGLATEADAVAVQARDLDHAVRLLPERLRQKAMRVIRGEGRDPRETVRQVVLLAGWSPQMQRVVGYRLAGAALFEAVLTTGECIPDVPEFSRLTDPHPEHVARVARAQMDALRSDFPAATGGPLCLTVVRPDSVTITRPADLAADVPARLEVAA